MNQVIFPLSISVSSSTYKTDLGTWSYEFTYQKAVVGKRSF